MANKALKRGQKGQATLFVILAIAIVAIIVLFTLFKPQITKLTISSEDARKIIASEKGNVENYVKECVKQEYEKAIVNVGKQGGYCSPVPVEYVQLGNVQVPYLVTQTNNLLQLEGNGATIASEIDRCVNKEYVEKCIDHFKVFKDINVKERGDITWRTSFSASQAVVTISCPLTLSLGDISAAIDETNFPLKTGLIEAYNAAVKITNSEFKVHDFDIDNYVEENIYVRITRQGTPDAIYYYLETVPQDGENAYQFNFAVKR